MLLYSAAPFRFTNVAGWYFINGYILTSWNLQLFLVILPLSPLIQINSILCFQRKVNTAWDKDIIVIFDI